MIRLSVSSLAGVLFLMMAPLAAQGQPAQLPEGDGKQLVQGLCTACHETNQITRSSGYTREDWRELIQTMIDLSGTPAGDDDIDLSGHAFSLEDPAEAYAGARRGIDHVSGMEGSHARPTVPRSGAGTGWVNLVGRAMG